MADFNMAANMYGLYPNAYNNQVALNDLTDIDMYSSMGSFQNPYMMNPMMGMNGSIFGGAMMGGYPMMPTFTGGTTGSYEDYYKNYEKYQDFMIDNQVRQQQKMRNADLRLNSPQEGIQKQAAILHEKILQNEQQQIQQAYTAFKESVRAMYGSNATDEEIANRASSLYGQITGMSLVDDIRQNGRGSFTQGVLQAATFGFADKKTAEENIAEMTGQPVSRSEQAKKIAGNVVGGAAVGGAGIIGAKYLFKAFCKGAKNKTLWAALVGGGIALAAALGVASKS